ncbi:MAG TPA: hypothetical protein VMI55_02105 [Thermoplasmata archaeon]|nr:hypothetical protein [Thermoplasmata archaeon]
MLPTPIIERPVSLLVYGSSLATVNLTLYALAEAANPEFLWINVLGRNEPPNIADPAILGWVPRDRLLTFEESEATKVGRPVTPAGISNLIAQDEPVRDLSRLIAFLRLPDPTQCYLATEPAGGKPGLVAVPNTHRVASAWADAKVEPILEAHLHAGYSLFVGYSEVVGDHRRPVGPGRGAFDYVFRVTGDGLHTWKESRLVCERGIPEAAFQTGSEFPLANLPFVASVFHRALSEPRAGMPRP